MPTYRVTTIATVQRTREVEAADEHLARAQVGYFPAEHETELAEEIVAVTPLEEDHPADG